MTVNELKNNPRYDYKCSINPDEYIGNDSYDKWGVSGVSIAFLGRDIGVEYNICMDTGENYSAIYYMEMGEDGYIETDYNKFIHYEIDFSNDDWEKELEDAMCKAMIELHNL